MFRTSYLRRLLMVLAAIPFFAGAQAIMTTPAGIQPDETIRPSAVYSVSCDGLSALPTSDINWRPALTLQTKESEPLAPDHEKTEAIKEEKTRLKEAALNKTNATEAANGVVTPVVGTNYPGNNNNGMSPMDNNVAISNGGIIVSVANTTIEYDDMQGNTVYYKNMLDIITNINPSITGICDPLVIYDSGSDRFIAFCQSTPLTSPNKIFVWFSKTNDPGDGWWIYTFNGDPSGAGDAFDYPKMAVSNNELFITGNMFYTSNVKFHRSIIFQMDKLAGYAGSSINYLYYTASDFTLLPVSYGQSGNYGPGIFMVSSISGGGSSIKLFQITNKIGSSPVLNNWTVSTTAYSLGGNVSQLGTPCKLDNGDCRILSGFYLNGIIHFVFHCDVGSGWNGINYNRLVVSTLKNTSSTFGLSGSYDYCFPSVVSYATSSTDKSVMIGFGRGASSIYPEVRVINCDDGMNWSGSVLVKSSSSYVSFTSTTKERWGDYTGTTRKHDSPKPSIWMNGMFGTSNNRWDTWVAEIHDNTVQGIQDVAQTSAVRVAPNPVNDVFSITFDVAENMLIDITIYDFAGREIKKIYEGNAFRGENVFTFNKANLTAGNYVLKIQGNNTLMKNEKIVVN